MTYRCSRDVEDDSFARRRDETVFYAGETTIGMLDVEESDCLCYLFDDGGEWRFYGILKEILEDEPSDTPPDVVTENGDPERDLLRSGALGPAVESNAGIRESIYCSQDYGLYSIDPSDSPEISP